MIASSSTTSISSSVSVSACKKHFSRVESNLGNVAHCLVYFLGPQTKRASRESAELPLLEFFRDLSRVGWSPPSLGSRASGVAGHWTFKGFGLGLRLYDNNHGYEYHYNADQDDYDAEDYAYDDGEDDALLGGKFLAAEKAEEEFHPAFWVIDVPGLRILN